MRNQEQAREAIDKTLVHCTKENVHGRARLWQVRDAILKAGYEHHDTLQLCKDLGYTTMGLTVLSEAECGKALRTEANRAGVTY